jgi:hypothetical protein
MRRRSSTALFIRASYGFFLLFFALPVKIYFPEFLQNKNQGNAPGCRKQETGVGSQSGRQKTKDS